MVYDTTIIIVVYDTLVYLYQYYGMVLWYTMVYDTPMNLENELVIILGGIINHYNY